jgi:hypothetical protein
LPDTTPPAPDTDDRATDDATLSGEPPTKPALVEALGGKRGLIDSGLPAVVFVFVNSVVEALADRDAALRAALAAAVLTGVAVVVLRVARKEPLQQAVSGFFALAIAVFLAARSGEARDFFLPGIFINLGYAALFLGSTVIGRPLVGAIYAAVDGLGTRWREDRRLRRAFTVATVGWSGVFLARAVVQTTFYNLDRTGWLATSKLLMGWPLTILAVAATVAYVRRAIARDDARA